ncbi:MAG TPA: 50S ribosomal protein L22, partial [Candidatus Aenigmarchaeota archaeon]|nr:50S ribosomal protein L22 [Candidatus Aenigmarchaeota archaeon]HEX32889.1 50S ribosomal protein L22 [Candidatus Aenigmarchaeota archaeon]
METTKENVVDYKKVQQEQLKASGKSKQVETKKAETKKPKHAPKPKEKPERVVAQAKYLPISTKHSVNVLRAVKGMKIDKAIAYLDAVIKKKRSIPFKTHNRKLAHRSDIEGPGRYPVKASAYIKRVIRDAANNATYLGLDKEKLVISKAVANLAFSRSSRRGKYTHVLIEVM